MTCQHLDGFPCICGSDEPLDEALMIWAKSQFDWADKIVSIELLSTHEHVDPAIRIKTDFPHTVTIRTDFAQFTRELVLALRDEFVKELHKALTMP